MPKKLRLRPPKYRGPGKPVKVEKPSEMAHVREGNFCGRCRYFVQSEQGREALRKQGFWDKLFGKRPDNSEIKPWMIGDPKMYSICEERNAAVHFFSTCSKWKSKDTFLKMFLGEKR